MLRAVMDTNVLHSAFRSANGASLNSSVDCDLANGRLC